MILLQKVLLLAALPYALHVHGFYSSSVSSYAALLSVIRNHWFTPWICLLYTNTSGETEVEYLPIYKAILNVTHIPTSVVSFNDYSNKIARVDYVDTSPLHVLLYADDVTKKALQDLFKKSRLFSSLWLLLATSDFDYNDFFQDIFITFDTLFVVAVEYENKTIVLNEVFQVEKTFPLNIQYLGNWSLENGLSYTAKSIYKRRQNMEGKVMVAAYLEDYATHEYCPTTPKGGFFGCIWNAMGSTMNYTTKYILTKEGVGQKGGTTGMIDLVRSGEADIAIGLMSVTAERSKYVEFLLPGISSSYLIFMRQEEIITSRWGKFAKTFDARTWLYMWLCMTFLVMGGVLCHYFAPGQKPLEYFQSTFFVYASICQQSSPQPGGPFALRLLLVLSYFVAVILYTAYCSSLISSLAVKDMQLYDSLEEFVYEAEYKIGVTKYSAEQDIFNPDAIFDQPVFNKLMKMMVPSEDNPSTVLEGMELVCSGRQFAFISDFITVQPILNNLPCPIFSLPTGVPADVSMALKKNFPFFGTIVNRYKARVESGVIDRLEKIYLKRSLGPEEELNAYRSVEIYDLVPYFLVLFLGFVISLVFLVVERLWVKRISNKTHVRVIRPNRFEARKTFVKQRSNIISLYNI